MSRFYRKGFYMNVQEQNAAVFGMIKDHASQRERLAALKNEVARVVDNFKRAATDLASSPELFDIKNLVPTDEVAVLVSDVRATNDEINRLTGLIQEAGHGNLLV
jgi:hypothetical protein